MSVFVDSIFQADPMVYAHKNPRAQQAARWGTRWCHMWAETPADIDDLHRIAEAIGLKRAYFQAHSRYPHYDLIPSKRALAIRNGANPKEFRDWLIEKRRDPKDQLK